MRALSSVFSFLLMPFAWLYGGIMRLRNYLYDHRFFAVYQAPVPVICVGNLSVGGTGKTPHVEYLANLLKGRNMAILSRGYKRKTTGFVLADAGASAETLGDEPFQYVQNLPGVPVAVCEKRAVGLRELIKRFPSLDVVLLDDAFQHRAVGASAYLLLTDYRRLFTQDRLLPQGRLREPRYGARRADAVIITKCPVNVSMQEQESLRREIQRYTTLGTPVFFSKIAYGEAVPIGSGTTLGRELVVVTGIARPEPLLRQLTENGHTVLRHFSEADHAAFSQAKITEIVRYCQSLQNAQVSLVMTQKDAVKWQVPGLEQIWRHLPVFYIPITVALAPQEPTFDDLIRKWAATPGIRE